MSSTQNSPQDPGGADNVSSTAEDLDPSVDLKDEELISISDKWNEESTNFHDELKKVQDLNEQYYKGNQTDKEKVPEGKCDAVDNKIFMGIETIVPIATANTPQFVAMPAQNNEISQGKADATQEILKVIYESQNVQVRKKLREALRHMLIYRFGVLKPYWDEEIDDVNVKYVRPQRIWIPKYGESPQDFPIIEKVDMDFEEIEEFFGEDKLKEVKETAGSEEDEPEMSRVVTVWECWTNDFVFWRYGSLILKKQINPYFDFTGRKEDVTDEFGNSVEKDVFYNHFRKPRKPYIFLSTFKLGDSPVGDTDLIQQAIPLQDIVNVINRGIVNNANKMGNGAWFIDADVMTEEEARERITNEDGLIIYGTDAANESKVRRESAPPLPNYIPNVKAMAEASLDNVMGTHPTSRGENQKPETLGGRILSKQADVQRSGTFVEEIDNAIAELGNWFCQLIKLYYEKEKTIKIYGEMGLKFLKFQKASIEDGMQMIVKAGSTLQQDELSQRNEALILFQNGALDPITLYERLKFPNPREAAEKLVLWKQGQLLPTQGGIPPDMKMKGQIPQSVNPQQEMREGQQSTTGGQGGGEFNR